MDGWIQPLLIAQAFVLGAVVGSFLNVVIYRLPLMMERDWKLECHEFLELAPPAIEDSLKSFINAHSINLIIYFKVQIIV